MAIYPIASMADGGIKYSDGSVRYSSQNNAVASGTGGYPVYNSATSGESVLRTTDSAGGSSNFSQPAPAPTGDNGGGGEPSGPSLVDQLRGSVFSELDKQLGYIDEGSQSAQNTVNTTFDTQTKNIQGDLGLAQNRLEGYRDEARTNKRTTLRNLADDFRNALQAGQVFLGAQRAGSSSAVPRLSGALAKGANKRTADVLNNTDSIMANINIKAEDVQNEAEKQLNSLNQWKAEQLNNITNWVTQQKASLSGQRADIQNQYNQQILQSALNEISNIQNQANAYNQSIMDWAQQRGQSIAEARQQIAEMSQYDVPGLQYSPFNTNIFPQESRQAFRYFGSPQQDERLQ